MSFAEGIKRSIEWFDADANRRTVDEEYDKFMDELIIDYEKKFSQA